ncbi:MAG: hypothetical protein HDS18_07320 [Bacteroides sp.]|nr:hypothetical protein [Bacteroides sp.]
MNVKVLLPTTQSATLIKANLLHRIGNNEIPTWSYVCSDDNKDVIFHNPPQYTDHPEKNVIFIVEVNQNENSILFTHAWWTRNPAPDIQQVLHHVARLNEMILKNLYRTGFRMVIS